MKRFAVSFLSYYSNELSTLLIEAENWISASEAHPGCCWKVEKTDDYECEGLISEAMHDLKYNYNDTEYADTDFSDFSIENKKLIALAKRIAFDRDHAFDVIEIK